MRKQGPCYHCGTQSTPLWRNGPAEKPVLCNACGSRYRIRGTLENYAPKHAQGQQVPIANKRSRFSSNNSKKSNFKLQDDHLYYSKKVSDDHNDSSSNKSTSSDSFNNVKEEEEEEDEEEYSPQMGGEFKVYKSCTPSRKRSSNLTSIEKLQKDLLKIMKYERKSNMDQEDDDLLIYNANSLQVSPNEIGIGSILLKPTN